VLDEYAQQLPLTLRQIFYRLVGAHGYEKSERAYGRLGETLNKARRAHFVGMDAVRDDGFTSAVPITFKDEDDFFSAVGSWAQDLRLDRQWGQPRRLALWCEASGMVPQLQRIAEPFGIGVHSSGGFDSLTDKHRTGREWGGGPVTVLHLGDHDPSGVHCFSALDADAEANRLAEAAATDEELQPIHQRYDAATDFIELTEPQSLAAVAIKLRRLLADHAPLAGFDREQDSIRQCVAFLEREAAGPAQDCLAPSEPEVVGFGEQDASRTT
jgi:hypothetical protein